MAEYFSIPLTTGAQHFEVQLGDDTYQITLIYRENSRGGAWYLDIELVDETDGIYGIPLVLGADLLAQYPQKHFGSLVCYRTNGSELRPGFDDVGVSVDLVWSA